MDIKFNGKKEDLISCENCKFSEAAYGFRCLNCMVSPLTPLSSGVMNFIPKESGEPKMKKYEVTTSMNIYKTYNIEAESMDEARRKGEQAFTRLCKEGIGKEYCNHKINFDSLRSNTEEIKNKSPLILICGKSGSGKTTIANRLTAMYGLKQLESYTTRPKRSDDEKGHMFMDDTRYLEQRGDGRYFMRTPSGYYWSDVPIVKDISGYKYWCTTKQLREADIYVIDPKTVKEVVDHIDGERPILIVWIESPDWLRTWRMVTRGDVYISIRQRFEDEDDWSYDDLTALENKAVLAIRLYNDKQLPYELANAVKLWYDDLCDLS